MSDINDHMVISSGAESAPPSPDFEAVPTVLLEEDLLEAEIKKEHKDRVLLNEVMEAYTKVRTQYEKMVKEEASVRKPEPVAEAAPEEPSAGNLAQFVKLLKQEDGTQRYVVDKDKLKKRAEAAGPNITVPTTDHAADVPPCPKYIMDPLPSVPEMQFWENASRNFTTADDRCLTHIPYMEDTVRRYSFGETLAAHYDEGIHGLVKHDTENYMNEWILYHLIKAVQNRKPETNLIQLFGAIHYHFPNKGSIRQMYRSYPDLVARFGPSNLQQTPELSEDASLEEISKENLRNLDKFSCKRCLRFACEGGHDDKEGDMYQILRLRHLSVYDKACENDCFLNYGVTMPDGGFKFDIDEDIIPEVSTKDKEVIALLRHTMAEDVCRIAFLTNKSIKNLDFTCKQMYAYIEFHSSGVDPRADFSEQRRIAMKKPDRQKQKRAICNEFKESGILNRAPYSRCDHKGACSRGNGCSCIEERKPCTKFCKCGPTCGILFWGCSCAGSCNSKRCECFAANWECDPDLCKSCTSTLEKHLDQPEIRICTNTKVQLGRQKLLAVGPSSIAGMGCYAAEDISKGSFISEYTGEVITCPEAERRGLIYDRVKKSYLFGLNAKQDVDAGRCGNITRFINHATKNSNCYSRILIVNGDHKIVLVAERDIKAGEELFFDYSYNGVHRVKFVPAEPKRKP